MTEISKVSETLYVPMYGRIFTSKHYPEILYDQTALSLEDSIPKYDNMISGQSEYTFLASAVRSKNVDYYIQKFLLKNPYGTIVNVGCGFETTFARNDNGQCLWYELDLPEVLELRQQYIPKQKGENYMPYSMFDYKWIDEVNQNAKTPVLIVASGLFYYFKEEQVIDFIQHLQAFDDVQLVFDAVSSAGIKGTKHYMRKMKKQDAQMFFWVDSATEFANKISKNTTVLEERKYYSLVNYKINMKTSTEFKMRFSDLFNMVKMVHLKI